MKTFKQILTEARTPKEIRKIWDRYIYTFMTNWEYDKLKKEIINE